RELHDVVGHSLGTIAVQAGVGRHLMSTEPASAAEALDNIAQLSRTSLDEVRAVVAALRDGEPAYRPAPGLTDLNGLVETARLTGLSVTLTLPDDLEQIPRQVAAAAFRITREALTNVIRHANASQVSVHVSHDNGHLQIRVHDNGHFADAGSMALTSPGHGIVGMRERAEALQGSLSAERATGGGFLVTASLPMSTQGSR
ncbi:MAG: sensor histidine kinase, partial [Ornithinimicrobium sp.]